MSRGPTNVRSNLGTRVSVFVVPAVINIVFLTQKKAV